MTLESSLKVKVKTQVISRNDYSRFTSKILKPCLPDSLPLYRRCQFDQTLNNTNSSVGEVWLALTLPKNQALPDDIFDDACSSSLFNPASDTPWLAAYINLRNSGQTQVWLYASWERLHNNNTTTTISGKDNAAHQALFDALLTHLRQDHIPALPTSPPDQWQTLRSSGKVISGPYSRSKVLFGTLHESLWPFLQDPQSSMKVTREDGSYLKYIISTTPLQLRARLDATIAHDLHFGTMQERHLQTVLDRNHIPRTIETLRQIPNVGVFDEDERPVAWGLLSKDASLASLHTEPEYRRRGLAEAVAKRLMQVSRERFGVDEQDEAVVYSHADVSDSNMASRKVMEKIGGKVAWRIAWIEVDVGEETG